VVGALTLLTTVSDHASYFPTLFVPFALMGLGMGTAMLPLMTIAMSGVPEQDAGLASGIVNVSMQLAGALGIAILGSILNGLYRSGVGDWTSGLSSADASTVKDSLTGAQEVGGAELVHHAEVAYVHGISVSLLAGAAILLSAALFVAVRAPGRIRAKAAARVDAPPTPDPDLA